MHSKLKMKLDSVARVKFPGNLEFLHDRCHRKLAGVIVTADSFHLLDRSRPISTSTLTGLAKEFHVICTYMLRLSQVTLEDVQFFYRKRFTQDEFAKHEIQIIFPILKGDGGAAARMIVGSTPPTQHEARLRSLLNESGNVQGLTMAARLERRMHAKAYDSRVVKPMDGILAAAAQYARKQTRRSI